MCRLLFVLTVLSVLTLLTWHCCCCCYFFFAAADDICINLHVYICIYLNTYTRTASYTRANGLDFAIRFFPVRVDICIQRVKWRRERETNTITDTHKN